MGIDIPPDKPEITTCSGCIVDLPVSLSLKYFDVNYDTWSGTIIKQIGTGTFFGQLWKDEETSLPGYATFCVNIDGSYFLEIGALGGGYLYYISLGNQGCFTYASGTDLDGGTWYLNE